MTELVCSFASVWGLAPNRRPTGGRAISARRTAVSLGNGLRVMPGHGGSSSSRSRVVLVVCCACSVWPHLRPILRAIVWAFLGPGCACLWSRGGPPGTVVTAWRMRVRRYRAHMVRPREMRARVCVWCSSVARCACRGGPILGAYHVVASYFGHAARILGVGSIVHVTKSLEKMGTRQETSLRVRTIHLPRIWAKQPNVELTAVTRRHNTVDAPAHTRGVSSRIDIVKILARRCTSHNGRATARDPQSAPTSLLPRRLVSG